MSQTRTTIRLGALAKYLDARLVGSSELDISGIASLENATDTDVSHFSRAIYRHLLEVTRAGVVILSEQDLPLRHGAALVVSNPYLAFARATALFEVKTTLNSGIHASCVIDPTATVDANAAVGPGVVVGAGSRIEAGVRIYANVVIGDNCIVGRDSQLMPGVVLYSDVKLGQRVTVHSGAVVGADGFGFTPDQTGHLVAIAQLGGVTIESDVSIGANTSIDRGTLDDTWIGQGVKIDNQVQIGHNTRIGDHTLICGCVGIVGSTTIGKHCVLAGGAGVGGNRPITLCDGVVLSATTLVTSSIDKPGVYSGGLLHNSSVAWKRNAIRFQELHELVHRVRRLEQRASTPGDPSAGVAETRANETGGRETGG